MHARLTGPERGSGLDAYTALRKDSILSRGARRAGLRFLSAAVSPVAAVCDPVQREGSGAPGPTPPGSPDPDTANDEPPHTTVPALAHGVAGVEPVAADSTLEQNVAGEATFTGRITL